jgi:hypothetical protein
VRDRALVSVFCMWMTSFSSTICGKDCLFSKVYFCHLCQNSDGCSCGVLVYSLFLYWYCAVFVIMALKYTLMSSMVILSALLLLLRIVLATQGLLCFQMNFRNDFFYFYEKLHPFWWIFHWICRLLSAIVNGIIFLISFSVCSWLIYKNLLIFKFDFVLYYFSKSVYRI